MYWTTISLLNTAESYAYPIISWFPFYSWIRFGAHLYLVLPGKQGSVWIYQTYIHPFLAHHEREIDVFIAESHEKAKSAGLQYFKQAIEWARVNVLGLQPRRPTPPSSRQVSYTSSLLSRFNMPSARDGVSSTGGANDLFSFLGNAIQQSTAPGSSRSVQAEDLAASGSLIPAHLSGNEKLEFISTQRDRLRTLLQAYESEDISGQAGSSINRDRSPGRTPPLGGSPFLPAGTPPLSSSPFLRHPSDLQKSRSEAEFEDLAYEDVPPATRRTPPVRQASWSKWVWGNYGEKDSATYGKKE